MTWVVMFLWYQKLPCILFPPVFVVYVESSINLNSSWCVLSNQLIYQIWFPILHISYSFFYFAIFLKKNLCYIKISFPNIYILYVILLRYRLLVIFLTIAHCCAVCSFFVMLYMHFYKQFLLLHMRFCAH